MLLKNPVFLINLANKFEIRIKHIIRSIQINNVRKIKLF